MSAWISINQQQLSEGSSERSSERGVIVKLSISPYDVPDAVRGYYDNELNRFVIEFRYIQDEPWERKYRGDLFALRIGRNSARVYGIEIDVNAIKVSRMSLEMLLRDAIEKIAPSDRQRRERNYQMVRSVVNREEPALREQLLSA